MERSVGGDPPPPPDPSGFPPLIPQGPLPAAAGAHSALFGAPTAVAAAVLGDEKGTQQALSALSAAGGLEKVQGAQQGSPSFAQLFAKPPPQVAIPVRVHAPAATDLGKPAAFFAVEEVQISCRPLDFTIVAKTPQGRPPFPVIRAHLAQRFSLLKDFLITPYDGRHLIIKLGCREDYLKMLLKATISVQGQPFWFSKWTIKFCPNVDSPLVPVWIELPRLPLNFYFEPMLRSIAGSIGTVLQIGQCTLDMTRAHAAAVCVQMDVSQPLPDQVWVGIGGDGFWQPIEYPNPPRFCSDCFRLGHLAPDCKKGAPPTDSNGNNKETTRGNERARNTSAASVIWREKPAAAKPVKLNTHAPDSARKVLEVIPQPESLTVSSGNTAQAQSRAVYLTPMKPSPQKRDTGTSAHTLHHEEATSPLALQQLGSQTSQHQEDAPQVSDKMTHIADQHGTTLKGAEVIHPNDQQIAHQTADASEVFEEMVQSIEQLSVKANPPAVSVGKSVGLSSQLNPAASAWSPSVHERGDIDLPDVFPPLPSAARKEQIQISARGEKSVLSLLDQVAVAPHAPAIQGIVAPAHSPAPLPQTHQGAVAAHAPALAKAPAIQVAVAPADAQARQVDVAHAETRHGAVTPPGSADNVVLEPALVQNTPSMKLKNTEDLQAPTSAHTKVSLFHLVKNMQKHLINNTSLPTATNESQLQGNTTPSSKKSDIMVDIDNIIQRTVEANLAFNGPPAQKENQARQMKISKICSRSGKDALQIPQFTAGGVGNDVSSSSGTRKMISRPRHKGGVRICLPYPRARSPSPPPPTISYQTSLNMEVGRSVTEQARADNILMPGSTFPDEESDDHDEEDDADDYVDERCRRRPGLRPRGALRHSHSWDDFSLEF